MSTTHQYRRRHQLQSCTTRIITIIMPPPLPPQRRMWNGLHKFWRRPKKNWNFCGCARVKTTTATIIVIITIIILCSRLRRSKTMGRKRGCGGSITTAGLWYLHRLRTPYVAAVCVSCVLYILREKHSSGLSLKNRRQRPPGGCHSGLRMRCDRRVGHENSLV